MNYYIKVDIAESDDNPYAYFAIKDLEKGKRAPLVNRSFPLDLLAEHEPKLLDLVAGDIDHAYLEIKKTGTVNMLSEDGISISEMSDDQVEYLSDLCKLICMEEKYDELLAPPSVDQQVEDFIKEFFDPEDNMSELENLDGEKPLDQKDFLAEFFAELEESSEK